MADESIIAIKNILAEMVEVQKIQADTIQILTNKIITLESKQQ